MSMSTKEYREQYNREYYNKYGGKIKVGDYVDVVCDGPGCCTGRVREISEDGITVNKVYPNGRVEEVFIEWLYIRSDFRYIESYVDSVHIANEKYKLSGLVGKECRITTSAGELSGNVIKKLSDAILIRTGSTTVCVLDIDVKDVFTYEEEVGPTAKFKDRDYMDVLSTTDAESIHFDCEICDRFLDSLEKDGYTEYLTTRSRQECSDWNKKKHSYDACAPTSTASAIIYVESKDRYYDLEVDNLGNGKFMVQATMKLRTAVELSDGSVIVNVG